MQREMNQQERRQILAEVVKTFGNQEWFRDAEVHNHHPQTGEPTLVLKVNYVPILGPVRKQVLDFAMRVNLQERFVVVDKDGKPVE